MVSGREQHGRVCSPQSQDITSAVSPSADTLLSFSPRRVKGSALAKIGYSCEQLALVTGWRKVWSEVEGTTDPLAPFGIVTLASSGSEGGPDIGAMRLAQTAGYGVLPGPAGSGMENTFVAQAFDTDDPWGPRSGPCL